MNTEDLDGFTHAATVFESGQVVLYCYLVCLWPSRRSLQLRKKEKMDLVFNPAAPPSRIPFQLICLLIII